MNIAVFGLGKIGLPLAVQCAMRGHHVIGVDVNPEVVSLVNGGRAPFPGEERLAEYLREVSGAGLLSATTDGPAAVAFAEGIIVAVPLYVDSEANPDFSAIDQVTAVIGKSIREGTLVSFETTLPVGTTRERIGPSIASLSGMVVGEQIHLVFSPERVLSGRVFQDLRRYPKLVGGVSAASEEAGVSLYESILEFDIRPDLDRPNGVWRMGSSEAAEFAKLAETTYRDVNIALANQFALFAQREGLDVYSVIEACNSQPYSHIHKPGVAVGGHCIPVYPRLYLWRDPDATVVRAARHANSEMPEAVARIIQDQMGSLEGLSVLILGAAYRGGVKETAFSGAFALVSALEPMGASVRVHDPLFTANELRSFGLRPYEGDFTPAVAIVHTDHQEYVEWRYPWKPADQLLVDGRAIWSENSWPGIKLVTLGRGERTNEAHAQ